MERAQSGAGRSELGTAGQVSNDWSTAWEISPSLPERNARSRSSAPTLPRHRSSRGQTRAHKMEAGAHPAEPIICLDDLQSDEALLHPLEAAVETVVEVR